MRLLNRARLLWSYLRRDPNVSALPVEYIVETTAKCNLYCPMCPRETHPQPKADMDDLVFDRLVEQTAATAEHMMLIGLGEPLLDPKIFDRVTTCERHGIATLLSTNGVLLDEGATERLLATPLTHITLSFDGYSKESFEFYRKGARFERVRDNFVRFCRRKAELKKRLTVVVQLVRMEKNWNEVDDFIAFWRGIPGVDQVRIKADETDLMQPSSGHQAIDWKYPCHYLWRGPMYVKQNGDVYPCCQSYMLNMEPVGNLAKESLHSIFQGHRMRSLRQLHAVGRAGEIDACSRCRTTIPHPILVAGSLLVPGGVARKALPIVERLVYLGGLPGRLLRPQKPLAPADSSQTLVQIRPNKP